MNALLSYRQLLRQRGVPEVFLAACLSRLAGRMVYALNHFHTPALVGWVAFASLAPGLAISPLAGALLDRIGAISAIAIDMVASAVLLFVLIAVSVEGAMTAPLMLLLVALFSLTSPLSAAAIRVIIPNLVPHDALDRANALDAGSYAVVDVVGPGICSSRVVAPRRPTFTLSFIAHGNIGARSTRGRCPCPSNRSLRGLAVAYSLYQASMGVLIVVVPILLARGLGAGAEVATGGVFAIAGPAGGLGALMRIGRRAVRLRRPTQLRTGNRSGSSLPSARLSQRRQSFRLVPSSALGDW